MSIFLLACWLDPFAALPDKYQANLENALKTNQAFKAFSSVCLTIVYNGLAVVKS